MGRPQQSSVNARRQPRTYFTGNAFGTLARLVVPRDPPKMIFRGLVQPLPCGYDRAPGQRARQAWNFIEVLGITPSALIATIPKGGASASLGPKSSQVAAAAVNEARKRLCR